VDPFNETFETRLGDLFLAVAAAAAAALVVQIPTITATAVTLVTLMDPNSVVENTTATAETTGEVVTVTAKTAMIKEVEDLQEEEEGHPWEHHRHKTAMPVLHLNVQV
jgi:hypothetical protein